MACSRPTPLQRLLRARFRDRQALRFYDVGAFQGGFALQVLEAFPGSRGMLFEPSDDSARSLAERFRNDGRICVVPVALSNFSGTRSFHVLPESPARSSLLENADGDPTAVEEVRVATLDEIAFSREGETVDLIKVDTQGEDLRVLQGAAGTIAAQHPVLVVEVLFIPRYQGQARPAEILAFADEHGYRLARLLDVHHTRGDELAFADVVLVPEADPIPEGKPPFLPWGADDVGQLRLALRDANRDRRDKRDVIQQLARECADLRARLGR